MFDLGTNIVEITSTKAFIELKHRQLLTRQRKSADIFHKVRNTKCEKSTDSSIN